MAMAKQRVRFTFSAEMVREPVIYRLGHDFDLVTNIRRADVRSDVGWVVLELEGSDEEIQRGLDWVGNTGVRVDPIAGDVIEG
jgi:ABC-type methionine transport system ATPase subunit